MTTPRRMLCTTLVLISLSGGLASAVRAADAAAPAVAVSGPDRFFLSFAEEAAIVKSQWWEGQLRYTNDSPFDTLEARLVVALQPFRNVELGGRVGFGNSSASSPFEGGTGATDLDAWGKYHFGNAVGGDTDFAAGGLVTVPTGDDTSGLGRNAFDLEAFGSLRHRTSQVIIGAQTGFRINGDGKIGGVSFSGKNSFFLGGGVIVPMSDQVNFVGELNMETDRVEGGDPDFRALGGVNWRPFTRGILRGAAAVGLTNGAPNLQITLGYAYTF